MSKGREMIKQESPIVLFEMGNLLRFCAALVYEVKPVGERHGSFWLLQKSHG
jgi:hypothetical protein